jgi:triosephosphate isomerase (TIM)
MRKTLIAGNWKMNLIRQGAVDLAKALTLAPASQVELLVLPAFVHLDAVALELRSSAIRLGAQSLCAKTAGAYTGETSAEMIKDLGCDYVLAGHSERRSIFAESDLLVAEKFARAQSAGLTPILCVGETLAERESGQTESVVFRQLDAVVQLCGIHAFADAVLAYEPLWAIGTGKTASPEQAQAVHFALRSRLAQADATIAQRLRILYGGSVKASNAAELIKMPDIDGALVGGASLLAAEFLAISTAALR